MDSAKAEQIIQAARSSMGMDMVDTDVISMRLFAERVVSLADYRKSLYEYLKAKMDSCAPNLAALIGEQVGARLISHAGSLTNLAKYPASTVQILGAEKALFRSVCCGRGGRQRPGVVRLSPSSCRCALGHVFLFLVLSLSHSSPPSPPLTAAR